MKKKLSKKTNDTAVTTLLNYNVTPIEIYYTRDTSNPSVVNLTIGATNNSSDDVTISKIYISIVIKTNETKPNETLTDQPLTIKPVSLQPKDWSFDRFDNSMYVAIPLNGGVVPANSTLTFQLQSIYVNESAGTTTVTIDERVGSVDETVKFGINKIRSDLDVKNFSATDPNVLPGGSTTLFWETVAAAYVSLLPGNPPNLSTNGSFTPTVYETTTFTLTAYGEGPNVSSQFTVSVSPPTIKEFFINGSADEPTVNAGDTVTLSWKTEFTNYCAITPGFPLLLAEGSVQVNPMSDTVYTLTAFSLSGKMQNLPRSVTVKPVSIIDFSATPNYGVAVGTSVTLTWDVESTTNVMLSPQPGFVVKKDSAKIWAGPKTIYSLAAQGKNGPVSKNLSVIPMMAGWNTPSTIAPWTVSGKPVLLMKDTQMWMMAMGDSSTIFTSDDGVYWHVAGDSECTRRHSAGGAVLNGKLWLMGGLTYPGEKPTNDVWSSPDGATWTKVKDNAQWEKRSNFGCIGYNGLLWVMGGLSSSGKLLNDVWNSSDGENWTLVTANAQWALRSNFGLIEFNGSMYVVCGKLTSQATNDLWKSTNGKDWVPVPAPQEIPPIYDPYTCAIVNRLYIAGGVDYIGTIQSNMAYMSTSQQWTLASGNNNIPKRAGCVQYQNAIWITGGAKANGAPSYTVLYYFPIIS